jgi:hypothetical protein
VAALLLVLLSRESYPQLGQSRRGTGLLGCCVMALLLLLLLLLLLVVCRRKEHPQPVAEVPLLQQQSQYTQRAACSCR